MDVQTRWRWLTVGMVVAYLVWALLLGYLIYHQLYQRGRWPGPANIMLWTWFLCQAAMVAVLMALAPTTANKRGLSLLWFLPLVAVAVLNIWFRGLEESPYSFLSFQDFGSYYYLHMSIGLLPFLLMTGGWLTLRHRSKMSYLALPVGVVVYFLFIFVMSQVRNSL